MCSGLAGGYFVRCVSGPRRLLSSFTMRSRILIYAVLGMAGAWAGRSLAQTGLLGKAQGLLMMGAGLLILVLARH